MGTNYYLHDKPDCECCGRPYEPLHIGKSSAGWCFALHVIPEEGINSLDDWVKRWSAPGAFIRNEYGDAISTAEMWDAITRRGRAGRDWDDGKWWQGIPGFYSYASEADFHARNMSERGPSGLLRARIGRNCIAHGEGTWDCITGEFS